MATRQPKVTVPHTVVGGSTNETDNGAAAPEAAAPAAAGAPAVAAAQAKDPMKLLNQWQRGIRISHVGHRRAAAVFARRARALGVGATVVSAIVGTTLFSSLTTSTDQRLIIVAAALSVVAVILTALQTFLNYGDLAAGHRTAATAFGDLRRRVEQLVIFGSPDELRQGMAEIGETWTKLDQESPELPQGIFNTAMKWVTRREASA